MKKFLHLLKAVLDRRSAPRIALLITGLSMASITDLHGAGVAFFFALDADLKTFAAEAKPIGQPAKVGDRTIHRFEIGGHRVYAVKMGSGAVETAVSASALLARFHCDLAISVGPVGALDDSLVVGSWHEVNKVVCYQHGSWGNTGFEMSPPAQDKLEPARQTWHGRLQLPPLIAAASKIAVASGEVFVTSSSYRIQLQAATGAQAVDMNLFGLQSACDGQQVPLLSWRIVSDEADGQAGDMFRSFVVRYDGAGGRALAEVVRHLPPDPNSVEAYPALKNLLGQPAPSSAGPKP